MTKDQRGKLVGMIYEYGQAMGRHDPDETVERLIGEIRSFLDEVGDEPSYVEIDGAKFEV